MSDVKSITAYSDRLSVRAGERLKFMVSSTGPTFHVEIVRLINGDSDPAGPGFKEEVVDTDVAGEYPGRVQSIRAGSHISVDDPQKMLALVEGFTLHALICPTTPTKGTRNAPHKTPQGILCRWDETASRGYALVINDEGYLTLWLGDCDVKMVASLEVPLLAWTWYSVAAAFDRATAAVLLYQAPVVDSANGRFGRVYDAGPPVLHQRHSSAKTIPSEGPFLIAAYGEETAKPAGHYNGKIDRPAVFDRMLSADDLAHLTRGRLPPAYQPIAAWDFAEGITPTGISSTRVVDSVSGLHGNCVNMPTRAVTGFNWTGREFNFTRAPEQYGAIHFHDDDLEDAGWEADFEFSVPDALPSDIYAARLLAGADEEYVPFYVRPKSGAPTARIAFLAPTASYLAYANDHMKMSPDAWGLQLVVAHTPIFHENDLFLAQHLEYGYSTYDTHSDGSGVCYSSRLRPILTMRPKYRMWTSVWQFNADSHIIDWLNAKGFEYDVLTDENLHHEGVSALEPYRVVLTGSHPEYYSEAMLDALEAYIEAGGRLIYGGGNGFYWVTSYHPDKPHLIEVRRFEGSRAWQAAPGEYYHSNTGELGGLWRFRGRPPQKLVGVGFTAEGIDVATPFRRLPDNFDSEVMFIFDCVDEQVFGDFGLKGGGAAGYEYDRYDPALGTPPGTRLLASSEGHDDANIQVVEEVLFNQVGLGGTQNPLVRADIVYYARPNGGAFFSASSISWYGSLSHNDYDNAVSQITENVLRVFASDDGPPRGAVNEHRSSRNG